MTGARSHGQVTTQVAPGNGYNAPHGSAPVRAVQRRLTVAGYSPGPIDGRYGALTEQAVMQFQADHGLQVDGIAGRHTLAALTAPKLELYPGAGVASGSSQAVRGMQRRLARAGYSPGPIDGRYGPLTEQAVMRFQAAHGLPPNGVAGPRTLASLHERGRRVRVRHKHRSYGSYRSHRSHSRPPASHRAPKRAPKPTRVRTPSHPAGSSPAVWLVLLGVLGLGLVSTIAWRTPRRRSGRPAATRPAPSLADDRAAVRRQAAIGELHDDVRRGHPARTEATDRRVEQSGDANGAFNLGVLLEQRGDLAGAESAYRRAAECGHASASCNLGVLLEEQRDLTGAEAAYRRAEQSGDANGVFNLGVLLEQRGDLAGAESAYRRAAERGHTAASCNLGVLLEEQGDLTGAEAAYRRAEQSGDANGAFNLGVVLEQRGELAGAMTAYREADRRGSAEVARMARSALHDLDGPGTDGNGGGRDA